MSNRSFVHLVMVNLLALGGMGLGCDGRPPSRPTHPTAPTQSNLPATPVSPLAITAVSPDTGSTAGGTRVKLTGTGLHAGTSVVFGGVMVQGRFDSRDTGGTIMYLDTPAHAGGTVAVVLTNPNGPSATLTRAYTYVSADALDFNGKWSGYGNAGQDIPIDFTIENEMLTSVSCDSYATLTFSPPLQIENGEFSFSRDDGVAVSGRIVSASQATGTLHLAPCTWTTWTASSSPW